MDKNIVINKIKQNIFLDKTKKRHLPFITLTKSKYNDANVSSSLSISYMSLRGSSATVCIYVGIVVCLYRRR